MRVDGDKTQWFRCSGGRYFERGEMRRPGESYKGWRDEGRLAFPFVFVEFLHLFIEFGPGLVHFSLVFPVPVEHGRPVKRHVRGHVQSPDPVLRYRKASRSPIPLSPGVFPVTSDTTRSYSPPPETRSSTHCFR